MFIIMSRIRKLALGTHSGYATCGTKKISITDCDNVHLLVLFDARKTDLKQEI